jgi:ORF6N domain
MNTTNLSSLPDELVLNKIYMIRNQKVMLDSDLAELYQVETKYLKRQVKRNIGRFPEDFMFELTKDECNSLRSQFGTLKRGEHVKFLPFVFTEYGILMLSSVLSSDFAIQVNIQIMRIFFRIRQMLMDNTTLNLAIEKLENKTEQQGKSIELIFQYIDEIIEKKAVEGPRTQIGYKIT